MLPNEAPDIGSHLPPRPTWPPPEPLTARPAPLMVALRPKPILATLIAPLQATKRQSAVMRSACTPSAGCCTSVPPSRTTRFLKACGPTTVIVEPEPMMSECPSSVVFAATMVLLENVTGVASATIVEITELELPDTDVATTRMLTGAPSVAGTARPSRSFQRLVPADTVG